MHVGKEKQVSTKCLSKASLPVQVFCKLVQGPPDFPQPCRIGLRLWQFGSFWLGDGAVISGI